MVKWSEVTKGMDVGGLGIRRLRDVNLCLLAKWWWKFGALDNVLWKNVVCSKYHYASSKWSPLPEPQSRVSRVWADKLSVASVNPQLFNFFQSSLCIHIDNGRRNLFWRDRWFGNVCLKEMFPRLFLLSVEKEGTVLD